MSWGKVRDEHHVGVFVLPTAQDTDVFTAALQCTIHIYGENGATAAAPALVSNFSQLLPRAATKLTNECDFILVKAGLIHP